MNCTKCPLHKTRRSIVIGRGVTPADVLFIGEGPGQSEDALGTPFVGGAGKLFDKMLNGLKFTYFITYCVLCHPCDSIGGKNREPKTSEVLSCFKNILDIYSAVNPKLVIFVGKVAEKHYKHIFSPSETILHPNFLLQTGGESSQFYRVAVNKLRDTLYKYKIIEENDYVVF